jgi:asparagine synthase (glutamine-hydrolysing)
VGGLDSSAVAATAARLTSPNKLLTITSVPPEGLVSPQANQAPWYPDERPYVKAIAAMYPNMNLQLASSNEPHWIETAPQKIFDVSGMPFRNISNIGWLLPAYEHLSKNNICALLTGEGGNPGWSYDGLRSLNDLLRSGHWITLVQELYHLNKARPYGMSLKEIIIRELIKPFEPLSLRAWRKKVQDEQQIKRWQRFSAINPDFASEIKLIERCQQAGHSMNLTGPTNGLDLRLYMLAQTEHGQDTANAIRALTGIERRAPLLDIRLLNFCFSIPDSQFLNKGQFRRLPRLAMAKLLPPSVLANNLIGSQNPEITQRTDQIRKRVKEEVQAFKSNPTIARILDLDRLSDMTETPAAQQPSMNRFSHLHAP